MKGEQFMAFFGNLKKIKESLLDLVGGKSEGNEGKWVRKKIFLYLMVDKLLFVFIFDSVIKDSKLILKCLHFKWIYKLDILYMKYILYSSYPMNSSAYSLSQTQSTSLQDLSQLLIHQD